MTDVPPPFSPLPPPSAAPEAPPRSMRQHAGRIVAAVVVVAVAAAVIAVQVRSHKSYPDHWDARVADIAQFDEVHRGLKYKHPVPVDFLTPDEYSKRTRTDAGQLSANDKKSIETYAGELRALGLIAGNPDLFGAQNDLNDNGTLAFYDPDTGRVTVRGTDMTPGLRVTLAHELTHVLQDQWFDVGSSRTKKFKTSQEQEAFRTIVEGDAVRIENAYRDTLSESEKQQADDALTLKPGDKSLSTVPVALQAFDYAPYAIGPSAVELLAAHGGNAAVDDALRNPPTTDRELLDPRALVAHTGARKVDQPALPDGVSKSSDSGDLGSITWYLALAERIDPATALDAVDGWAGDSYVTYDQNGVTCMALEFAGTDDAAVSRMQSALGEWAQAMPGGTADVRADGDRLLVHSCDPGSAAATNDRALDAIQLPSLRIDGAFEAVDQGGLGIDKAFDYGECLARTITFAQLHEASKATPTEIPPDVAAAIQTAYTSCISRAGG